MEVFVCNHKTCGELGAKDLTDRLKKWSKEELDKEIRIYRSGCLGKCEDGIAMACFPQKKFLLDIRESDFKEIKKNLEDTLNELKST